MNSILIVGILVGKNINNNHHKPQSTKNKELINKTQQADREYRIDFKAIS